MAPEVLSGNKYNYKADIWSVGISFYEMLFGDPPFKAHTLDELLKMIKMEGLKFPVNCEVSDHSKKVLFEMLEVDPSQRISWDDLFTHQIC